MMEILAPILCCIITIAATAYYWATSRAKTEWIAKLEELVAAKNKELADWQNKALARQGISPLGRETEKREPKPPSPAPSRVVHRGELRSRVEMQDDDVINVPVVEKVTVHAQGVDYKRVRRTQDNTEETVRKAADILGK